MLVKCISRFGDYSTVFPCKLQAKHCQFISIATLCHCCKSNHSIVRAKQPLGAQVAVERGEEGRRGRRSGAGAAAVRRALQRQEQAARAVDGEAALRIAACGSGGGGG